MYETTPSSHINVVLQDENISATPPLPRGELYKTSEVGLIPLLGGVARENKTLVCGTYVPSRDGVVSINSKKI